MALNTREQEERRGGQALATEGSHSLWLLPGLARPTTKGPESVPLSSRYAPGTR